MRLVTMADTSGVYTVPLDLSRQNINTAKMVFTFAGGGVDASAIMRFIVNSFSIGLRFAQTCIDFQSDGAGDSQVFENFLLLDRSVTCIKLFAAAYRQVHTEGFGKFAASCLIGMSLHLFTIVIYLYSNHRSRTPAWMCGMAILLAAAGFLLGLEIRDDYVWHNTAVEAIIDLFTCLETALLLLSKIKDHRRYENFLRDLFLVSAETLVNMYLFAEYVAKTQSHWDAEKILHLVGSCLAVLIGLCQIFWMAYIHRGEEQAAGAATDGAGGVDLEQQTLQEVAQVLEKGDSKIPQLVLLLASHPPVFIREIEMSDGAAKEDEGGGDDGEKVPPEEEGVELAVVPPA